jgi:hypothetical protein
MKGRVKKKDHEKLTSTNILKVIGLLEPSSTSEKKPITKKAACELLNITYNTTRLGKIISEHKDHMLFISKQKAHNRGKPATPSEISTAIINCLEGTATSDTATTLFRSPGFIKAIIERIGVPHRPTNPEERTHVSLIPEGCVSEVFQSGEVVWSAKYHRCAIVGKEVTGDYEDKYLSKCYRIYVVEPVDAEGSYFEHIEKGGFNAYALAYDLGKLEHLKDYGVDLSRL